MIMNPAATTNNPAAADPWKPCDLRGLYPDEISPELFQNIGCAIGTIVAEDARVLVCGDFRLSTPELKQALIQGLLLTGVTVSDAGQAPTPLAYFTAAKLRADAVLIVTASHNPPAHNGLKLMIGPMATTPRQLLQIRALTAKGKFRRGNGRYECVNLLPLYRDMLLERWGHLAGGRFARVVLDAGNGAMSELAPRIFSDLGYPIEPISCVTDGHFPDRSPDCSRPTNLARLRAAVLRQPNSIGIAWDGDGDRVAFVDEAGKHVSTDEISILFAREVLRKAGGSDRQENKIVVDIKFSDLVGREIGANGGTPLLERSGHAFMRGRMVTDDALLGLDACGHYFYRELDGGDDGLFSALFFIDLLQRNGMPLSELRRTIPQVFGTPELRIPVHRIGYPAALERLRAAFPYAGTMEIDGLRLMMEHGVVLIRESGTEPMLSLRVEGFDQPSFEHLVEKCLTSLPEAEQILRGQISESEQA
jgi:phosphomannomutase / phosphoglucomutase